MTLVKVTLEMGEGRERGKGTEQGALLVEVRRHKPSKHTASGCLIPHPVFFLLCQCIWALGSSRRLIPVQRQDTAFGVISWMPRKFRETSRVSVK